VIEGDLPIRIIVQRPEQFQHVGVIGRELVRRPVAADDYILSHRTPRPAATYGPFSVGRRSHHDCDLVS
jgi:hypothetical protein